MQVLLTGGTGFIGTALARRLLADGHAVRLLSRSGAKPDLPSGQRVEHVQGTIEDAALLAAATAGCDALFHLAAREDFPLLPRGDRYGEKMFAVNVLGTDAVLRAARASGLGRAVVVTSCTTFGHAGDGVPNDGTRPQNISRLDSVYVWSRVQQEQVCLAAAAAGQDVVVAAPSAIVGPGDQKGTARTVEAFLRGRLRVVPPGGFNFIAIEDVVEGLLGALQRGRRGGRYLFTHENLTYREFLGRVGAASGQAPPRVVPRAVVRAAQLLAGTLGGLIGVHGGIRAMHKVLSERFYFDARVAVEELGLPQTPIDAALARTIESLGATRRPS
jgi:dihydroflavonol-4-reductase